MTGSRAAGAGPDVRARPRLITLARWLLVLLALITTEHDVSVPFALWMLFVQLQDAEERAASGGPQRHGLSGRRQGGPVIVRGVPAALPAWREELHEMDPDRRLRPAPRL
jgi:hypothetical protein